MTQRKLCDIIHPQRKRCTNGEIMKMNYKIENYYKCEKCKHFAQHYNIEYNYIYKVNCGHCYKYDKDINPK